MNHRGKEARQAVRVARDDVDDSVQPLRSDFAKTAEYKQIMRRARYDTDEKRNVVGGREGGFKGGKIQMFGFLMLSK